MGAIGLCFPMTEKTYHIEEWTKWHSRPWWTGVERGYEQVTNNSVHKIVILLVLVSLV